MRLYREAKGDIAYTIIEADEKIKSNVVSLILDNKYIEDVKIIEGV